MLGPLLGGSTVVIKECCYNLWHEGNACNTPPEQSIIALGPKIGYLGMH